MTMPTSPQSYEIIFHDLLRRFSSPAGKEEKLDVALPMDSEKDAEKFRLRYYAFLRATTAYAERKIDKARKAQAPADWIFKLEREAEEPLRAKRFTARIRNGENIETPLGLHSGWVVEFTDRDEKYAALSSALLSDFLKANTNTNTSVDTYAQQLRAEQQSSEEQLYLPQRTEPRTTPAAINPLIAAMADVPAGKTSSTRAEEFEDIYKPSALPTRPPRNPVTDTLNRLQTLPVGESFTLKFDSAKNLSAFLVTFQMERLTRTEMPQFTTETQEKSVTFTAGVNARTTGSGEKDLTTGG